MENKLADFTTSPVSDDDPTIGGRKISADGNITDSLILSNFQYVNISVRLLMGLLAISSNLLTVVAIGRYEFLQNCTNYLIAALAIGDMIGGFNCLLVFFNYISPMLDETWLKMCAVEFTFTHISAGLNLSYILFISVDRFIYITFPLRYHSLVTPKLIFGGVLVPCALLAIHFTVIHLDAEGYNKDDIPSRICNSPVPKWRSIQINMWIYVTAPITVLLYSRIAWIAYRQSRAIGQAQAPDANNKKEYKITKMLSLVLGVYFACYLPFSIADAVNASIPHDSVYKVIATRVASWTWWINSWANPLIYAWKNKNFNRAFRSLLGLKSPAIDSVDAN